MYFLGLFKALGDFLSNPKETIMGAITHGLRIMFYFFDTFIYDLLIKLCKIFNFLCTQRLVNNTLISSISVRVGALLGVIMLFIVSISFVRMLINPDTVANNEKGAVAVIKKVLIVVVMLGVSNYVFETLFLVQRTVISSGAISKLLLPSVPTIKDKDGNEFYEYDADGNVIRNADGSLKKREFMDVFGGFLAEETFHGFYNIDLDTSQLDKADEPIDNINECKSNLNELRTKMLMGEFSYTLGSMCLNNTVPVKVDGSSESIDDFIVNFNGPISCIVGIAMVYFMFMYCISVGMRMIQLMILEIISPMAIVSYLSPNKDNMFSKWIKMYFSTYIDVFVRVAIINFACLIITGLFSTGNAFGGFEFFEGVGTISTGMRYFIIVIMVLALLAFAKKAPELLKDLLPAGNASKLDFGASMKDAFGVGALFGAAGGAIGGAAGSKGPIGMLTGATAGMFRGGAKGLSGKSPLDSITGGYGAAKSSALKTEQRIAAGGSRFVMPWSQSVANSYDMELEKLESDNKKYSQLSSNFKAIKERAKSKIMDGAFDSNVHVRASKQASNKADILTAQAGNAKVSDFASKASYDKFIKDTNAEIVKLRSSANDEMDKAVEEYSNINRNSDPVLANNFKEAESLLSANSKLDGFRGQSVASFAEFKAADGVANSTSVDNNIKIAENKRLGERARANAKYGGSK